MSSVGEELSTLKEKISKIPNTDVISCHPSLVQIKIKQTDHRQLIVCCQFPENYPSQPLLVELKSKTIAEKMLEGMVKVCDQELQRVKGQPQILHLVRFMDEFLTNNPFVVCSEELNYVKHTLASEADSLKVKHRTGVILYKATQDSYFIDFRVTLPNNYPNQHVRLELKETTFPPELTTVITGHVTEKLRQCVEPPLKRKPTDPVFEPRPSLRVAVDYVVTECVRKYPLEKCSVCELTALPRDPQHCSCFIQRGIKARQRQTTQLHSGQLFFQRKEKRAALAPVKSCSLCVSIFPRHTSAFGHNVLACLCNADRKECAPCDNVISVVKDENNPGYVYRIYCGHLYHRQCIEEYLKKPPFTGGKKCLVCGERVAHDKWNISSQLAEQRWAHHQARLREIDEVVDFLS